MLFKKFTAFSEKPEKNNVFIEIDDKLKDYVPKILNEVFDVMKNQYNEDVYNNTFVVSNNTKISDYIFNFLRFRKITVKRMLNDKYKENLVTYIQKYNDLKPKVSIFIKTSDIDTNIHNVITNLNTSETNNFIFNYEIIDTKENKIGYIVVSKVCRLINTQHNSI